jgi:predicted amidohydrolase
MKVALIQHDIVWEDADATRAHIEPMIAQAVAAQARLIVLPEMYATGFSMRLANVAEDEGGPNETFIVEQAIEHDCWIVGTVAQWAPGREMGANVAILAGPDGSVHRYVKIHPFSYGGEDKYYVAGKDFLTVDIDGVRVSVFICYDLRFADEFWQRAHETDCYVVPANWPAPRREHWQTLLRARAIENQAYVVGVNRVGAAKSLQHKGDSAVIDPLGVVLTTASDIETVLFADIDVARVQQVRDEFPFLPDRR